MHLYHLEIISTRFAGYSPRARRRHRARAMPGRWDLKGMTCVVTGGSKGLGLACVTEMLQLGASVLLTARGVDELEAVHKLSLIHI